MRITEHLCGWSRGRKACYLSREIILDSCLPSKLVCVLKQKIYAHILIFRRPLIFFRLVSLFASYTSIFLHKLVHKYINSCLFSRGVVRDYGPLSWTVLIYLLHLPDPYIVSFDYLHSSFHTFSSVSATLMNWNFSMSCLIWSRYPSMFGTNLIRFIHRFIHSLQFRLL